MRTTDTDSPNQNQLRMDFFRRVLSTRFMSRNVDSTPRNVLLTGGSGFLGKVLLEELVRRREELKLGRVFLLVRRRGAISAAERFCGEVAPAECFSDMPAAWSNAIEVVEGDLTEPDCGLDTAALGRICGSVTQVLHCAASIDFDLPLFEATLANVTSTLHLLELAKRLRRLERMVTVSTAYATVHPGDTTPIEERLAPLPRAPESLYQAIRNQLIDERILLRESGHPNTYTLTKCLAERLLVERRDQVPLTIVRPSIISASWRRPFPGWIDSPAAFAGVVSLVGAGYLRAIVADLDARLDMVPVDWVARAIVDASVDRDAGDAVPIRHVAAGLERSPSVRDCREEILGFFSERPIMRPPRVRYIGPPGPVFDWMDWLHNRLPVQLYRLRSSRARRRGARVLGLMAKTNRTFSYFSQRTFNFRASAPVGDGDFHSRQYLSTICGGVFRHLLHGDPAGRGTSAQSRNLRSVRDGQTGRQVGVFRRAV